VTDTCLMPDGCALCLIRYLRTRHARDNARWRARHPDKVVAYNQARRSQSGRARRRELYAASVGRDVKQYRRRDERA